MYQKNILVNDREFLSGGGEMGELIRAKDWSKTALGSVEGWPQSLRTMVSVCLNSKFPILLWWGRTMAMIYNDAYRPMLGKSKHPFALGANGKEVWEEIWDIIGPMLESVLYEGKSTWSENQLLLLNRYGYAEECYFTFSYSPIYDESGSIGGIFCAVTETTEEVISNRHLNTVRDLSARFIDNKDEREIYSKAIEVVRNNNKDFPFAMLYAVEGENLTLVENTTDLIPNEVSPHAINLNDSYLGSSALSEAVTFNKTVLIENIPDSIVLPSGGWKEVVKILVLPITQTGNEKPFALLITGMNPHHLYTDKYKGFFQLCVDQIASEIVNVRSLTEERKRAEALHEIDKAKTVFFSNVSHEFRTPLTLMLGPLEDLLNDKADVIPDKHKEGIETAHRNAMRLLRLVNTLLDFSRMEAGRISANYHPVNLTTITRDLASTFRSIIEGAGLTFDVHCENLPELVYADIEMWEKIVLNLLSNAFKHTLQGKIVLQLTSGGGHVVLKVMDTGVGIPSHELPHLFERFHRIKNSGGRTFEGTGIGLSLVKELVKFHGGTIEVESKEGKGSTFIIAIPFGKEHLPAEQVSEDPNPLIKSILPEIFIQELKSLTELDVQPINEQIDSVHTELSIAETSATKAKILVVDDNGDMRGYLERLLSKKYTVRTAANGKHALEILHSELPDLIISDIMMPAMNGIEFVHTMKSDPLKANIPVILLSARAGEEARIEGYETGADDYLVKPFSAKELLARVKSQIEISQARRNIEQQIRNLFSRAPVAICLLKGPEFIVEQVNHLMLTLWRKTSKQVMHKPLREAFPQLNGQGFIDLLTRVYITGVRYVSNEHPVKIVRKQAVEDAFISFTCEPLREIDSSVSGIMVIAHEVTELVISRKIAQQYADELEKEVSARTADLKKTNEQLIKINYDLEQFAYVSSHDLQEPLRKIQTFTELIAKNFENKLLVQRYLNKIDSASSRMSKLIKSILTYSKVSKTEPKLERVNLNRILEDVMEDFELLINEKNGIINYEPLPEIHGDPLQIHQLFSNLISNSLKFSEKRPVVTISADNVTPGEKIEQHLHSDSHYIKLIFQDNGIGFDQEYADKIFTMFQRLNNKESYEGTGIGLALCKKIAENHNGCISVSSVAGEGSTFTVYLQAK